MTFAEYGPKTTAFLDTFSGMIPCVVTEVLKPGANGKRIGRNEVKIRITKDVGAYRKGEILTESASNVVPRNHRIKRGYTYRINVMYQYN